MDFQSYKKKYFIQPSPKPIFNLIGFFQIALYFHDYTAALQYYTEVLGPPTYVEGDSTHGWRLGSGWLTLFPTKSGNPRNMELTIHAASPVEAERLQQAFIKAGGSGTPPSDQLMYEPIRYCQVKDPFGTDILIISPIHSG